jgi:hypothetical protein
VTVANRGNAPVNAVFWVDVYVDPDVVPSAPNQTWELVGQQGLAWSVLMDAMPLEPGDAVTLRIEDAYYWPMYSDVTWPLALGTPVYAQVDSANEACAYGAILEQHEIVGGVYNNIARTEVSAEVGRLAKPTLPCCFDRSAGRSDPIPPRQP